LPYLSVIITGRNDDYGVDFLGRISTFVLSLDHQCQRYPGKIELVVLEWNPQSHRPPLRDVLPACENIILSVITVSSEIHDQLGTKIPVLEMYGKNTGARHSLGQFVLITNPDIVFTQQLVDWLCSSKLDHNTFYRTDRYDFYSDGIQQQHPAEYVDFAAQHTFVAHCAHGSLPVNLGTSLMELPSTHQGPHLHTNASGDFMLLSRQALNRMNGLFTSLEHRWHNDSYSVIRMDWIGLKQVVLTKPLCIFHQHHERVGADHPWDINKALEMGRSLGPDDWGLAGQELMLHRTGYSK
jgi:hypothetical protein